MTPWTVVLLMFLLPLFLFAGCSDDLGPRWDGPPRQLPTTLAEIEGEDEE